MAAKQIAFDQEAREAMRKGIAKLAKAVKVTTNEETKSAFVVVPDNQLSLAIGKAGQNVQNVYCFVDLQKLRRQLQIDRGQKLLVDPI